MRSRHERGDDSDRQASERWHTRGTKAHKNHSATLFFCAARSKLFLFGVADKIYRIGGRLEKKVKSKRGKNKRRKKLYLFIFLLNGKPRERGDVRRIAMKV